MLIMLAELKWPKQQLNLKSIITSEHGVTSQNNLWLVSTHTHKHRVTHRIWHTLTVTSWNCSLMAGPAGWGRLLISRMVLSKTPSRLSTISSTSSETTGSCTTGPNMNTLLSLYYYKQEKKAHLSHFISRSGLQRIRSTFRGHYNAFVRLKY